MTLKQDNYPNPVSVLNDSTTSVLSSLSFIMYNTTPLSNLEIRTQHYGYGSQPGYSMKSR